MSDTEEDVFVEPMRMWRDWYQKSERQWSEAITEVMADERMGKRFGKYFQEWLHAQHMFTEMVGQQLASLNMPSRADVLGVGDRLSEVEDTLSSLSVDIHELKKQLAKMAAPSASGVAPPSVRRTRKPAAASAGAAKKVSENPAVSTKDTSPKDKAADKSTAKPVRKTAKPVRKVAVTKPAATDLAEKPSDEK
jgi:hypothetical protein